MSTKKETFWLPPKADVENDDENEVDCICIGTGRFLRSVLVPPLVATSKYKPVLIQTRGTNFLHFMHEQQQKNNESGCCYPIDTVNYDGTTETVYVKCFGAFSWGTPEHKQAVTNELINSKRMKRLNIIGLGVTEAGLASSETQVMKDLYDLLKVTKRKMVDDKVWDLPTTPNSKICIINMDNVPNNGDKVHDHMMTLASSSSDTDSDDTDAMKEFLSTRVCFLNTMVDRITSQRPDSQGLIPRCEPIPAKALVICDPHNDLPQPMFDNLCKNYGLVVRRSSLEIEGDVALKLRIANATHTAIAHVMALIGYTNTDLLAPPPPSSSAAASSRGGGGSGGGATTTTTSGDDDNDDDDDDDKDRVMTAQVLMGYLDSLVEHQIQPTKFPGFGKDCIECQATWKDWRPRLTHPHFGLSTFFITQNGAAKGGIRLGPTLIDLLLQQQQQQQTTCSSDEAAQPSKITVAMAYAFAVLIRWLTPAGGNADSTEEEESPGVYTGWLAGADRTTIDKTTTKGSKDDDDDDDGTVTYADGLRHNLKEGWYEFKCACKIGDGGGADGTTKKRPFSEILADFGTTTHQPSAYCDAIRSYLLAPDGGNLGQVVVVNNNNNNNTKEEPKALATFIQAVATLYARMIAGDSLVEMLEEMSEASGVYHPNGMATSCDALVDEMIVSNGRPLFYRPNPIPFSSQLLKAPVTADNAPSVVVSEVASASVIDLHTHLLPPSHGSLCLWGIDELLTYHYLVAEYFMTAPASVTPESFYALTKREQADVIWNALFLERSPISEACRGVITTLVALGLHKEVAARDLKGIRKYYSSFRDRGLEGTDQFSEMVYSKAGVQYAIMTNIPFDSNEAQYWRPERKDYSERYRSALRVDPLLAGDRATVEKALKSSGYEVTLEGARQYLRDWCDTMKPEYMMASTPHDFVLQEGSLAGVKKTGVNEEAMKEPFAFVDQTSSNAECVVNCDGAEDEAPTVLDENSDLLSEVLMKVCEERNLPVALKIGAHRGVNPKLKSAGDGVVAFADAGVLGRLCSRFPKVLFLATFLSRNNQHEAAVLASKFRNLHIYGCWWFCNNPSIIREITSMRIEMLGTAFTAQHSDARVLDQLLYKWPHSRAVIAKVLSEEYSKLYVSGWTPTRGEIRRDIGRLFGASYEEFLSKSLLDV